MVKLMVDYIHLYLIVLGYTKYLETSVQDRLQFGERIRELGNRGIMSHHMDIMVGQQSLHLYTQQSITTPTTLHTTQTLQVLLI